MDPVRWHSWHFACRIGGYLLVNVGGLSGNGMPAAFTKSAAIDEPDSIRKALQASTPIPSFRMRTTWHPSLVRSLHPLFAKNPVAQECTEPGKPVSKEGVALGVAGPAILEGKSASRGRSCKKHQWGQQVTNVNGHGWPFRTRDGVRRTGEARTPRPTEHRDDRYLGSEPQQFRG